jgi:hypothetical protein
MVASVEDSHRGAAMRMKGIAVLVIVAVSAALFVAVRSASRADAANGNCYSEAAGPASPTICN